jgi:hypothetical protein
MSPLNPASVAQRILGASLARDNDGDVPYKAGHEITVGARHGSQTALFATKKPLLRGYSKPILEI